MKRLHGLAALCLLALASMMIGACSSAAHPPAPKAPTYDQPSRPFNSATSRATATPAPFRDSANQVGGSANPNDAPYDAVFFRHYGVNPFIDTEDDNLFTFAMDVDTVSYTVARRFLTDGNMPAPESVRVEEFINYFDYRYDAPDEGAFAIHVDGAPSPFGDENHWLMRVGIQGKEIRAFERRDATLIFVIDVSGSMAREDRLGLVKRSLHLLLDELRPTDEVGIVTYGSRGRVLLEPVSGEDERAIARAIDGLQPEGSTNAEEGLRLGYQLASRHMRPDRITRVILLSDGVANVGNTGAGSILETIERHVERGVTLTTVGFGMGNYNDVMMEQLANKGDGSYAYVDSFDEANRIFVENLTGTLQVIARDAKVQVDFNPRVVSRFRLLGYENRRVADEDFRNDAIDAGEVGAGHSVTALYELKLREGAQGRAATVLVHYEDPDEREVVEMARDFGLNDFEPQFEYASPYMQLAAAVAEYAEILRESYWALDGSLEHVLAVAQNVRGQMPRDEQVADFVELVAMADAARRR